MEQIPSGLPPKYDQTDPVARADPYGTYARLRQAGSICRGGPGQWVVTRYAEVAALLGDPRLGSGFPEEFYGLSVGEGPAADLLQRIVLHHDGVEHARLRKLMGQAFARPVVRALRPRVSELVDELLSRASDRGVLEVVADLATPLPLMVICDILGLSCEQRHEIRLRALDLGKAFSLRVNTEDRAVADEAVVWLRGYVENAIEARRRDPADDLLSRMASASRTEDGPSRQTIVDNTVFLLFAGFETTASLISTGCAALLRYPDQRLLLREDPSLIPRAIEEFLRYDAPIQSRLRLVLEPVEIGKRIIRPGRLLLLLIGSANHDERQFNEPEELDVTRSPNPHLSFGGGEHYCLGAGLARLEGMLVFERLLRWFDRLEPAGEMVRDLESPFRAYRRMPIRVSRA